MPTIVTHAGSRAAFAQVGPPSVSRGRLTFALVVLSVFPDLDVVAFQLGIPYSHWLGHRGFYTRCCSPSLLVRSPRLQISSYSPDRGWVVGDWVVHPGHRVSRPARCVHERRPRHRLLPTLHDEPLLPLPASRGLADRDRELLARTGLRGSSRARSVRVASGHRGARAGSTGITVRTSVSGGIGSPSL